MQPAVKKSERGQSLVEFALLLPIFLVLVLAVADFGWALRSFITATNSAREGARLGVTGAPASAIQGRAVATSANMLTTADVTVSNPGGTPGSSVVVNVNTVYHYITPLVPMLHLLSGGTFPDPLPIKTSATMRLE